ncbi:MAG: hypothetical protein KC766_24205 [Myxococcales bacterium]|nr:hypothetical protein [Myxococcales bacterium]
MNAEPASTGSKVSRDAFATPWPGLVLVPVGALLALAGSTWSFDQWNNGSLAEFVGVACLYLGGGVGLTAGPLCLLMWACLGERTRPRLEALAVAVAALAVGGTAYQLLKLQGDDPLTEPVKDLTLLPVPLSVALTLSALVCVTLGALRSRRWAA